MQRHGKILFKENQKSVGDDEYIEKEKRKTGKSQENIRIFEDKQTINQTDRKQLLPLPPIKDTLHTSDETVTHRQREKNREIYASSLPR